MSFQTDYIDWLKSTGLKPRTINEYEKYLNRYMKDSTSITQKDVNSFLIKCQNNVARAFIRSLIEYLMISSESDDPDDWKERYKLSTIRIKAGAKKARKIPKVLKEEEVNAIAETTKSLASKLMVLLSFWCGLRMQELLGITKAHLNIEDWLNLSKNAPGTLHLTGDIAKRGKERKIPVPPFIMNMLIDYINENIEYHTESSSNPLFPVGRRKWARILEKASLEALNRHVNPHLLRHSYATHLLELGFRIEEVKDLLGHEDIGVTQIYTHVSPKVLFDKFENVFKIEEDESGS